MTSHVTTEDDAKAEAILAGLAQNADTEVHSVECETAIAECPKSEAQSLMEAVVDINNLRKAFAKVRSNNGAAGVDNVPVSEFKAQLQVHWPQIKEALLEDRYRPQPVRRVDIPKANGGTRTLGIPTVMDRFIQQALLQVLQPIFEPVFSDSSYGFRPGRNAWQAVEAAKRHIHSGKGWVVDMDLEKFFDRVNHDILMSRIARKVEDKRVLRVIRRYLQAGMMEDGLVSQRVEGTPQGGPLSPLLSNILLTDLDRELERRGHAFCRYADDCNIYVASEKAGLRVLESVTLYLQKSLKLQVNQDKSAVARPSQRKFLGYSFTAHSKPLIRIAVSSLTRLKDRIHAHFSGSNGRSPAYSITQLAPLLRGWMSYFRLTESKGVLEALDQWLRRKLRCVIWRQAKRPGTRYRMLRKRGLPERRARTSASNGRGPWWNSGAGHMNAAFPRKFFDKMGLVSLVDTHRRFNRFA